MDLVFAGASFPCGVREMGEVANRHGIAPTFLEHPHNADPTTAALAPLVLSASIPNELAVRNGLFLPLLESWVSEGQKLPPTAGLLFDRRAAAISRSKLALSKFLGQEGLAVVRRYSVGSIEEAINSSAECGYPLVLRSDSGYSGRGVWVVESGDQLREFWELQSRERGSSGYEEMRAILISQEDNLVIEPWLAGDEWSIDCVVGPTGTSVIRVCEKAMTVLAGRPVTLGYRLSDDSHLAEELTTAARRWCQVLFSGSVVSFACFDVRRTGGGDLVPLDFGARLGGDGIPHFVLRSGNSGNPYVAALDAALGGDLRRMTFPAPGAALVHVYARVPGTLIGLAVDGHGEVVSRKPPGFRVEHEGNGPVHRKVGTVLTSFETRQEFFDACRNSADWIRVDLE